MLNVECSAGRPSSPRPSPPRRGGSCSSAFAKARGWSYHVGPRINRSRVSVVPLLGERIQVRAGNNLISNLFRISAWLTWTRRIETGKLVGRPSSPRPSPPRRGGNCCRVFGKSRDWIDRVGIQTIKTRLRKSSPGGEDTGEGGQLPKNNIGSGFLIKFLSIRVKPAVFSLSACQRLVKFLLCRFVTRKTPDFFCKLDAFFCPTNRDLNLKLET